MRNHRHDLDLIRSTYFRVVGEVAPDLLELSSVRWVFFYLISLKNSFTIRLCFRTKLTRELWPLRGKLFEGLERSFADLGMRVHSWVPPERREYERWGDGSRIRESTQASPTEFFSGDFDHIRDHSISDLPDELREERESLTQRRSRIYDLSSTIARIGKMDRLQICGDAKTLRKLLYLAERQSRKVGPVEDYLKDTEAFNQKMAEYLGIEIPKSTNPWGE